MLLLLALVLAFTVTTTPVVKAILPELVRSDFTVTLGDHYSANNVFVEVEDSQKKREEEEEDTAVLQMDNESVESEPQPMSDAPSIDNESVESEPEPQPRSSDPPSIDNESVGSEPQPSDPPSIDNESVESEPQPSDAPSIDNASDKVTDNQTVLPSEAVDKETDNITGQTEPHLTTNSIPPSGKENNINHECIIDEDCGKGRYCLFDKHKCLRCKAIDVPCTKDEECCSGQLCVWGQCTQNATKGEAGNICQYQTDCSTDLCCALHKALLFPVCSAKPIERERCYGSPNHLMALLSWDMQGEGPREHCPCAGNLECQPLGRGSMCLKEQNSSEEEMTDTLYSEIDYIV